MILFVGFPSFAHDFEVDGIFYIYLNQDTKTVAVSYKGSLYNECPREYSGKVTIPSSVTYNNTTFSVTSIGEYAFYGCDGLTSVNVPNSVTSIDYSAFQGCTSLTSVNIPNSVTSIGNNAFRGCERLTSITIPNSITEIGYYAFNGCISLSSVTIGNSVTKIDNYTFNGCISLSSVTIGNSVTSIGPYAFHGCKALVSINIPNSVTDIGNEAFRDCTSLTSVTIGNSVKYIRSYAFSGTNLTSIKSLNTTPPTCGDGTFSNCYNAILEVPAEAKEAYSKANVWKNFSNIIEFATVKVSIQEKKATFYIPTTENAETYTVNVYSDEAMTQLVDYTIYDVTGKILPMATTLEMSIDGLEYGLYYYDVIAKSKKGETLKNYTGTFDIGLTGIENISSENENFEVARYDIYGRLLTEPTKGINIIKMSDGSTRKVIVK